MDDLIIRSLQGLASEEEERHLRQWIAADPDLERWFRSIEETWNLVSAAAPKSSSTRLPDVDVIIARAALVPSHPLAVGPTSAGFRDRFSRFRWPRSGRRVGILAGTLVVVVLGFQVLFRFAVEPIGSPTSVSTIVTGAEGVTTVTFDNGSAFRVEPRGMPPLDQEGASTVVWPPY